MKLKRFVLIWLLLCMLLAVFSPAPYAADSSAIGDFMDRYGDLLGDGVEKLTGWLSDKTAGLSPELRETLRDVDTDKLLSDLKALVGETSGMSDEELREAIVALSEKHGIHLVDAQIEQLMALCRSLEKLDAGALKDKVESLKPEIAPPSGLRGLLGDLRRALRSAADWLSLRLSGLFR